MFHTLDFDAGDLRRLIEPHHTRSSVYRVLSMVWLLMPPEEKSVAGVGKRAREIIAEAIAWWRPLDKSDPDKLLRADGGLKFDDFQSLDPARITARNMVTMCWIALPEGRRRNNRRALPGGVPGGCRSIRASGEIEALAISELKAVLEYRIKSRGTPRGTARQRIPQSDRIACGRLLPDVRKSAQGG